MAVAGVVLALCPIAAAQQPTTTRVNLSSSGGEAHGGSSSQPSVSADGRFVAFLSSATDLVGGDTNAAPDVFLRDRQTNQTRRVNLNPDGSQVSGATFTDQPRITADGRFVFFRSDATTLVPGSTGMQLFVHDRPANAVRRVPAAPAGYALPQQYDISDDGSQVAFSAVNLTDFWWDVFVADMATGAVRRVSETSGGVRATPPHSFDAAISGDGRWVAFTSEAKNFTTDTNPYRDVYAKDLATGAFARVSVGAGGAEANLHSSTPTVNRDGCFIAFYSDATNLVAGDSGANKVFLRHRCSGETEKASITNANANATASVPPLGISRDGCRVLFKSANATSPAPAAGSGAVFRDTCAGSTQRLDLSTNGDLGSGNVDGLAVSGGTGRYVVFDTTATNLVPGDGNGLRDVFLRDRAVNAPPEAALTLSQQAHRVTASALASRDPDGFVLAGAIAFGDGTPAQPGLQAVHEYAKGGTYSVTVTVTDADGLSRTATQAVTVPDPGAVAPPPPGGLAPGIVALGQDPFARLVLDRVALSRRRFAVVPRNGRPTGNRGAQLSLRLSAAATVTLTFERARRGRRVRGRCVAGARRGARCTVFRRAGSFSRSLRAGTSTIVLTGRVGTRALTTGTYRLTVRARTRDGRQSSPRTVTFTIIRRR